MSTWMLIFRQQYSENTPEYGFGDYPEQIPYIGAVITSESKRKAQNIAKKIYPRVTFGGMFSPLLIETTSEFAKSYMKPADPRLDKARQQRHNDELAELKQE